MKKIGVGVVGCGFVGGQAHVPAFNGLEDSNLAAVADADPGRLSKPVQKYGIKSAYPDYKELVKDPTVDAVVVAVPTPMHARVALAAIEAGKHVLCEMPLSVTMEECDKIIDAAKKKGVILMPSLNFRFAPNYVKAKELFDSGAIGKPTAVLYREFVPAKDLAMQWPPNCWVWNMEESGGPLYTLSVWAVDLYRWFFDTEVVKAQAATNYTVLEKFGGTLGYDSCTSMMLGNGIMACLQFSSTPVAAACTSVLEVIGDSTYVIKATGNNSVTLLAEDPVRTDWDVTMRGTRAWGHRQLDEYFLKCIKEGKAPKITPEDARKAMEIGHVIGKGM